MPDREKIVHQLGQTASFLQRFGFGGFENIQDAIAMLKEQEHKDRMFQALEDDWKRLKELLKEQEAVEPYVDGEGNYCCGACDTVVGWEELTDAGMTPYVYKFCPMCGKGVQWNDGKRL